MFICLLFFLLLFLLRCIRKVCCGSQQYSMPCACMHTNRRTNHIWQPDLLNRLGSFPEDGRFFGPNSVGIVCLCLPSSSPSPPPRTNKLHGNIQILFARLHFRIFLQTNFIYLFLRATDGKVSISHTMCSCKIITLPSVVLEHGAR